MKKALISLLIIGLLSTNVIPIFSVNASTTVTTQAATEAKTYQSYQEYEPILKYETGSITFNGETTKDVSKDASRVDQLSEGTIAIKFKTNIKDKIQTLFSVSDLSDTNSYFEIKMVDGKLRLETMEDNKHILSYTAENKEYADDKEHTLVLSGGERGGILYVDGEKVVTAEDTKFHNIFISAAKDLDSMMIGGKNTSLDIANQFNGEISFVEIYDEQFIDEYSENYSLNDYRNILSIINDKEKAHTILFAGDSITHGVRHTYGYRSYSEHLKERLREINEENIVINTGSSGATTNDAISKYKEWIEVYDADIVFITFGMNDCADINITVEKYKNNLKTLINNVRNQGGIPILQAINPPRGDREAKLPSYMIGAREVANELQVLLVDHNQYWSSKGKTITDTWLNDQLHPNKQGQLELNNLILRELKLDTEDSETANLEYPLISEDTKVNPVIEEYAQVAGKEPVLSYKINENFNGQKGLDKESDISKINELSSGSIVARFRLTATNEAKTIISLSNKNYDSREVALGINPNGVIFVNGRVDTNEAALTSATGGYNDGKWHTVVVNADDSKIDLYVDGIKLATKDVSKVQNNGVQKFFAAVDTPTNLSIGKNVDSSGNQWFFNGDISFVDIYKESLSIDEINKVSTRNDNTKGDFSKLIEKATTVNTDNSWVLIGNNSTSGNGGTLGHKNYGEYLEEKIRWELNGSNIIDKARHVINVGIDNANSIKFNENFEDLVAKYKPEIVSIMLGENENCSVDEFKTNLQSIIDKSKKLGAEVLLQTPVLQGTDEKNNEIKKYVDVIVQVSKDQDIPLIDHYNEWMQLKEQNSHIEATYLTDGKLNYRGHIKVARDIMEALDILKLDSTGGGTFWGSISAGAFVDMNYKDQ